MQSTLYSLAHVRVHAQPLTKRRTYLITIHGRQTKIPFTPQRKKPAIKSKCRNMCCHDLMSKAEVDMGEGGMVGGPQPLVMTEQWILKRNPYNRCINEQREGVQRGTMHEGELKFVLRVIFIQVHFVQISVGGDDKEYNVGVAFISPIYVYRYSLFNAFNHTKTWLGEWVEKHTGFVFIKSKINI